MSEGSPDDVPADSTNVEKRSSGGVSMQEDGTLDVWTDGRPAVVTGVCHKENGGSNGRCLEHSLLALTSAASSRSGTAPGKAVSAKAGQIHRFQPADYREVPGKCPFGHWKRPYCHDGKIDTLSILPAARSLRCARGP